MQKISEGKTKIVYTTENPEEVLLEFKDSITALDGKKHDVLKGKGKINAEVSAKLFEAIEREGVPTHFIKLVKPSWMLARKLTMIPMEVVCRNLAAGHFISRFPVFKKGQPFKKPIIEFYWKNDALHDPILVEDHVAELGLASEDELKTIRLITGKANAVLIGFLIARRLRLADFKLEFGRSRGGSLFVGDELNCDSMRLWDTETGRILDKDSYRQGSSLEEVMKVYQESRQRILFGEGS